MLIVGAKGFAKEVLEILHQKNELENLYFFDDVSENIGQYLHSFPILHSTAEAKKVFETDARFTLGVGSPLLRKSLFEKFISLGGIFTSTISPKATIGHYGNHIGKGCNIMSGTVITNDIQVADGCLINLNCTVGHDSNIGMFTELSPGVSISGNCTIGSYCNLGTNATVLPKVKLGNNVIVGAGAVVTKDVADGLTVVGIPAKPISK